jgi:hypothetical protein
MTDAVDNEWDFTLGVKHIHMRSGRRRNDLELSTGDDFCRMHCHSHTVGPIQKQQIGRSFTIIITF